MMLPYPQQTAAAAAADLVAVGRNLENTLKLCTSTITITISVST